PRGVDRRARNARDDDNIALSAELVDEPLRGLTAGGGLIDGGVVSAGFGDDRVIGKNEDALVAGALNHLVQGSGRDRIDDDGVGSGLNHSVDLLDLALRVRTG